MAKSSLRLLVDILSESVKEIEQTFAKASLDYPSLDDLYDPSSDVETLLQQPKLLTASSLIVAAASQLIATIRSPAETLTGHANSCNRTSCLRAVIQGNLVEIIRDGGPEGIHVQDIAKKSKTDPLKVSRILRLLAADHIFKEVSPEVFILNRISSVLDSGKSLEEIEANPTEKHTGTLGVAALVEVGANEVMKGSAYLPEVFLDPELSHSVEPTQAPWNMAFKTNQNLFQWYDENEYAQRRFAAAMAGTTKMEPSDVILRGFKWHTLPEDGTIVDVGGGVGSTSIAIARAVPHIKVVIQDRQAVLGDAELYWKTNLPNFVDAGRLGLQPHDFFQTQPIKDAAAFLLRFIVHDWSDPYAKKILQQLREAAAPTTKLIVVDVIVPYACKANITDEIPGAALPPVPEPLLPNLGEASRISYLWDMGMFVLLNSQDRTLGHFVRLAAESGWKVVEVHHIPGSRFGQYVAIPV